MGTTRERTSESVRSYVFDHRDSFLETCRDLVEIETPSDEPETIDPAFDYLEEQFKKIGFQTHRIPGRETAGCLYAAPSRNERTPEHQLLLGHVDTVWSTGTLEERPFRVEGDRARGPGLFDMKAGLAQIFLALECLRENDLSPSKTPLILVNSDEEIGSPESTRTINRLASCVDRALVFEPAITPDGAIKTARKGLGHFTVTIQGKASHAGLSPEEGQSAIVELSHIIQALNNLNDPDNGITVNVGVIEGGSRSNVVAAQGSAEVDVRVLSQDQADELEASIRNLTPENENVELSIEGGFRRPPMERTPGNRELWRTIQAAGQKLGLELEEGRSGGGSDGNLTSQHTPTVDGLGAVGGGAHEEHEYIEVPRTLERAALLSLLLLE